MRRVGIKFEDLFMFNIKIELRINNKELKINNKELKNEVDQIKC